MAPAYSKKRTASDAELKQPAILYSMYYCARPGCKHHHDPARFLTLSAEEIAKLPGGFLNSALQWQHHVLDHWLDVSADEPLHPGTTDWHLVLVACKIPGTVNLQVTHVHSRLFKSDCQKLVALGIARQFRVRICSGT